MVLQRGTHRYSNAGNGRLAAIRKIRVLKNSKLAELPVIAMTSKAFQEDIQAADAAGMEGHIARYIDIEKMMAILSAVPDRKK